jgi:hypothetical protein
VGIRIRLGILGLVLCAAALGLVACGGGVRTAAGTPTPASNASGRGAAFQAYADCLRQHGVNLPRGNGSRGPRPSGRPSARPSARPSDGNRSGFGFGNQPPPGVDAGTWQNAQQACASLRPSAGPGRDNGAFAAYRNCLADHGVTMSGPANQLNTADPKVAAALKTCEPLRPTAFPSRSAHG